MSNSNRDSWGNWNSLAGPLSRKQSNGRDDSFMSVFQLQKLGKDEPDVEVPQGNAKKGAKVFKSKCAQCHSIEASRNAKVGPTLNGVFGRVAGTSSGCLVEHLGSFRGAFFPNLA